MLGSARCLHSSSAQGIEVLSWRQFHSALLNLNAFTLVCSANNFILRWRSHHHFSMRRHIVQMQWKISNYIPRKKRMKMFHRFIKVNSLFFLVFLHSIQWTSIKSMCVVYSKKAEFKWKLRSKTARFAMNMFSCGDYSAYWCSLHLQQHVFSFLRQITTAAVTHTVCVNDPMNSTQISDLQFSFSIDDFSRCCGVGGSCACATISHVFRLNPNAKQQSSAKQLNLVEVVH